MSAIRLNVASGFIARYEPDRVRLPALSNAFINRRARRGHREMSRGKSCVKSLVVRGWADASKLCRMLNYRFNVEAIRSSFPHREGGRLAPPEGFLLEIHKSSTQLFENTIKPPRSGEPTTPPSEGGEFCFSASGRVFEARAFSALPASLPRGRSRSRWGNRV